MTGHQSLPNGVVNGIQNGVEEDTTSSLLSSASERNGHHPERPTRRGRQAILEAIGPVVDAYRVGFKKRFGVNPGPVDPLSIMAAVEAVKHNELPLLVELVEGAMLVGTYRLRTEERWKLFQVLDELPTLISMWSRGELR